MINKISQFILSLVVLYLVIYTINQDKQIEEQNEVLKEVIKYNKQNIIEINKHFIIIYKGLSNNKDSEELSNDDLSKLLNDSYESNKEKYKNYKLKDYKKGEK